MSKHALKEDTFYVGEGEDMRLAGPKDGGRKNPKFLLGRAGQLIDEALADRLGLIGKAGGKAEDKAAKKGEDKGSK